MEELLSIGGTGKVIIVLHYFIEFVANYKSMYK